MSENKINNEFFPLSEEHRMLLRMRDTLYEGSWEDFVYDLKARAEDRPHVFQTVPTSPHMKATIQHHLTLIERMSVWETKTGTVLSADSQRSA